jgi:hypothetical protein
MQGRGQIAATVDPDRVAASLLARLPIRRFLRLINRLHAVGSPSAPVSPADR